MKKRGGEKSLKWSARASADEPQLSGSLLARSSPLGKGKHCRVAMLILPSSPLSGWKWHSTFDHFQPKLRAASDSV